MNCLGYFFVNNSNEDLNQPVLAALDVDTHMRLGCLLPHRGANLGWPAQRVKDFIRDLGYGKVSIASDQEHAILALIDNIKGLGWVWFRAPHL